MSFNVLSYKQINNANLEIWISSPWDLYIQHLIKIYLKLFSTEDLKENISKGILTQGEKEKRRENKWRWSI